MGRKNTITETQKKDLINLYLNTNLSTKEIMFKVKIKSESKFYKILNENNITLKNKKCDENSIKKILDLYLNKKITTKEISEQLNISKTNVIYTLNNNNVNLKRGVDTNIENKIIELYTSRLISLSKVAEIFQLTNTTICNILKRNNIKIRSYSQAKIALADEDYEEYLKTIPEFIKYRRKVLWVTNQQEIQALQNFDKRGKAGQPGAYNLDHKYSIIEGFKNNIEPKVIGNIHNLEMLPWKDNVKKHKKCSITLDELINKIKEHEDKKS